MNRAPLARRGPVLVALVLALAGAGCSREAAPPGQPAAPATPSPTPATAEHEPAPRSEAPDPDREKPAKEGDDVRVSLGLPPVRKPNDATPPEMNGTNGPAASYERTRKAAISGDRKLLERTLTTPARRMLGRFDDEQLRRMFTGEPGAIEGHGGRAVVTLEGSPSVRYAVLLWHGDRWLYDITLSLKYQPWDSRPDVPENRHLTLDEATAGLEGEGALVAEIETTDGTLYCRLFEDVAPRTVANFVGLARGLRAFLDTGTGKWVERPFYDGLVFHRCVPGFMIQGGDPNGTGSGGPGYTIEDELDLAVRHDRGGTLAMASAGPNTAGSQFFITEEATHWLDDRHSVFGECGDLKVVAQIARRPKRPASDRPLDDVVIRAVRVYRQKEAPRKR